jgi:ABC-type transport system substrate-binding protein
VDERNQQYKQFQKILYEEQPALFLVSPQAPIAATADLIFKSTSLRPGYFENTMVIKK